MIACQDKASTRKFLSPRFLGDAKVSLWDFLALILPTTLIASQLVEQIRFLWPLEHLQFFPFAFIALAYFTFAEGKRIETVAGLRRKCSLFVIAIGYLLCLLTLILNSHWLSHASLLLLLFGWMLKGHGESSIIRIAGIIGLVAVTLPAPMGLDLWMIKSLQSLSANICSGIMDSFGIVHIKLGNVLETTVKPLFVEEACSGIDSQYALMAVAGVLLLLAKSNLFVSLLTIVTVPIWAIVGNVIRICAIVVGLEYFDLDLSTGIKHTILGLVSFALAAWAHWSSVQVFNLMSDVIFKNQEPFNRQTTSSRPVSQSTIHKPWIPLNHALFFIVPVCVLQISYNWYHHKSPRLDNDIVSLFPGEDALPKRLCNLSLSTYRHITRTKHNSEGEHSLVWTYADANASTICSLDMPFRGWHALWECYINTGWKRVSTKKVTDTENGDKLAWPFFECALISPEGETAILRFSLCDENGQPFDFSGEYTHLRERGLFDRLLFQTRQAFTASKGTQDKMTFQFQTLTRSKSSDVRDTIEADRQSYVETRQALLSKCLPALRVVRGDM